jgi:3-methyladenine DNA glycosylase AlkD
MLEDLKKDLRMAANPEKAVFFPRFFKAGPGQYAEGDKFLGVTVPAQRAVAKKYANLSLQQIEKLLTSEWHEYRLTALLILVNRYKSEYKNGNKPAQKEIYDFYLAHTANINNWDLVDSSAGYIVGPWLEDHSDKMAVLTRLANSELLWERRIAMLATFHYIVNRGRADEALFVAEVLLHDNHDLIQKAVGWMLREVGKRVDHQLLVEWLKPRYKTMPRTMLRYAIEHFDAETRQRYLKGEI